MKPPIIGITVKPRSTKIIKFTIKIHPLILTPIIRAGGLPIACPR